jgi:hypothetical protein
MIEQRRFMQNANAMELVKRGSNVCKGFRCLSPIMESKSLYESRVSSKVL